LKAGLWRKLKEIISYLIHSLRGFFSVTPDGVTLVGVKNNAMLKKLKNDK